MWVRHPLHDIEADEQGRVRRYSDKRAINGSLNSYGYLFGCLGLLHRLVYECHKQTKLERWQSIDHIDACKTNNAMCNLQILGSSEHNKKTHAQNPEARKSQGKSISRIVLRLSGENAQEFSSIKAAAQATPGATATGISHAIRGVRQKTHAGFAWKHTSSNSLPREEWRSSVAGMAVSNLGRVRLRKGRETFGSLRGPYLYVGSQGKTTPVHTLVCTAFHGNGKGMTADHIDRDGCNNASSNLRWATKVEQAKNRCSTILVACSSAERTWEGSISDLAKVLGFSRQTIAKHVKNGKSYHGHLFALVKKKTYVAALSHAIAPAAQAVRHLPIPGRI